MRELLFEILNESKASFTEIRIEKSYFSEVRFRGKELDSIGSSTSVGGIVRCLENGGWGIAVFDSLDNIPYHLEKACESAKMVGSTLPDEKKVLLCSVPPVEDEISAKMDRDFREIPINEKKRLLEGYNDLILCSDRRIVSSHVYYFDKFIDYYYANSEGTYIHEERPDLSLYLGAIAKDSESVQNSVEGVSGKSGYNIALRHEDLAKEAAKRACDLLTAKPVVGGTYEVILDQVIAGTFVHEAFGHLSESDHLFENEKLRNIMTLGKEIGPKFLNILDDGSIRGLRGTHKYDDEGVCTRKNYLVRDGVLVGRLHSRETAKKMNENPTGNARALNYQHEPIVRMTNTYIDKGSTSFDEILVSTKNGIYAKGFIGGNTAMELFTFSAAYGYAVRDGKIEELRRDIVLSGNLFKTLLDIEFIGNDLEWKELGGCGKNGQNGLPTPHASPHIKIGNVMVGGR